MKTCAAVMWCDQDGKWLLLDTEQERMAKEQERIAKEQGQGQLVQAAQILLAQGMSMDEMVTLLGLTDEQLKQVMEQLD
jgi:gamma-glutamyl:cysteine ligase YbdK (ATP-grasp superfamily)